MTPKLSCYFVCQIRIGTAFRGGSGASARAQRGHERNGIPGTLAGANQPLDFFQMGFDLALEGKRIEHGVFVHQCSALLLRERAVSGVI